MAAKKNQSPKKAPQGRATRKTKPRVCPGCLTPRPGYRRMKYPPPCPNCKSAAPPVKQSASKPAPAPAPPSASTLRPEIVKESGKVDLKGEFTVKELNFLEVYLGGGITIDDAMISAGYGALGGRSRYNTANKILEKHVLQAGDIKKVMRSCGLGEIQVCIKLKQLMEDPSKTIQMRATELAAKILEMTKESTDLNTGIQIVIKTPDGKIVQPTPAGQAVGESRATQPKSASLPATGPQVRMIK